MRTPARAHRRIALGACAAALLSVVLVAPAVARVHAATATTAAVTITNSGITVVPAYIPAGAVVFKIANKGTVARTFKVGGKTTPPIPAGGSTVLNMDVTTELNYPYYAAAPGHSTLSGILVVIPSTCSSPSKSTVTVRMSEDAPLTLSRTRVPCGTVTFVVHNTGFEVHSFTVFDTGAATTAPGGYGPRLRPGKSATMVVHFARNGRAFYFCREPGHSPSGERGFLVVY